MEVLGPSCITCKLFSIWKKSWEVQKPQAAAPIESQKKIRKKKLLRMAAANHISMGASGAASALIRTRAEFALREEKEQLCRVFRSIDNNASS